MAVWTPRRVVPHLLSPVHGTLVRRDTPSFSAIHSPVLHILVPAGIGGLVGVQRIADLADRLDDVARIR